MTSDGHQLRESWSNALNDALEAFRSHLTSSQSSSWKRVPFPVKQNSTASEVTSKQIYRPEPSDVAVHRKATRSGDIYRVVAEVPVDGDIDDLEAWRAILVTPELRQEWDSAVESSKVIEMFDPSTRIVKTKFTLGWPANPRDAVMISRTFSDSTTIIDISTSLPRSQDEPSYLRPSPPYVRSRVDLFAWCVQLIPSAQPPSAGEVAYPTRRNSGSGRLRITCFWHHDLRTVWNIGAPSSISQQLSETVIGLYETVKKRHSRVTVLSGYGFGISIERISFDIGREALTIEYDVIPEEEGNQTTHGQALHGLDELHILKEQRRLQRSLECVLPSADGWDIRLTTRAYSQAIAQLPWSSRATRIQSAQGAVNEPLESKVCFQVKHSSLLDDHSILKVKVVIEYSGSLKGIRLDGLPHKLDDDEPRNPMSFSMSNDLFQDASSAVNASVHTGASIVTVESDASSMSTPRKPALLRTNSNVSRPPAADKSILTLVRRNYIYFSSLLQEPEAKWKRNTEARGVSVTQLDSIDPTLVVYKAEATFVGVGLWDLYSAVVTPGARIHWDRQYDDAVLIEDVNELSELWYYKTKPAWPVAGRDAVLLKTVYKSPTTVHVFSFSIDDPKLFSNIPPNDPNLIRTQVDLQGWAIESLSPNTTLLTLLEQSDPKGWSGKSTIPQQMISLVAGVGEFAIKCGGPPIVTRLGSAKAVSLKYEHERGLFRIEYAMANSRRLTSTEGADMQNRQSSMDSTMSHRDTSSNASVECELRCDIDTWATALDIVIDPPPQTISCLRRHRLSAGGGGLWLTIGHDISFSAEDRLLTIVRRAPFTAGKEKGVVMVNGKRISVDVEELLEAEVKSLAKQKRVKPVRIPLDQPPVLGVIRRRRHELGTDANGDSTNPGSTKSPSTIPTYRSPLSTFFYNAVEQARTTTQQTVAAFSPAPIGIGDTGFSPNKKPMQYALDALAFVQGYHRGSFRDNWTPIVDKVMNIHRRPSTEISASIHVHKGEKVIEGATADEVANVIVSYDCRRHWDDRFDSVTVFEEFGADCHTAFLVSKGGFAFRDRGFYLASMMARGTHVANTTAMNGPDGAQSPSGAPNVIYCVSASFNPDSVASFSPAKYNSYSLPIGRIFLDGWILETLDPYTSENYEIPSTRCTRLVAADYAGSIPVAVNSLINSALPRAVLAVEAYLKGVSPFPEMKLPAAGFAVTAYDSSNIQGSAWSLKLSGSERTLLASKLTSGTKVFQGSIIISFSESSTPDATIDEEGFDETPKMGLIEPPSRSPSPVAIRRPRVDSMPSPRHVSRHRRISSTSTTITPPATLSLRSRSRDALRSSSAFSIGREFKNNSLADFVVAEVIVDLRLYPDGYDVRLSSQLVMFGGTCKPLSISTSTYDAASQGEGQLLPLSHSVHLLPPSPLHSSVSTSGSSVEQPTRHLLRISLPTAQYLVPTIDDPLTGETRSAPPKPEWYRDLEQDGKAAIVYVTIEPLAESCHKKGRKIVRVGGNVVNIISGEGLKNSRTDVIGVGLLSRIPIDDGADALPKALTSPIAVADDLYDQTTRPNVPSSESQAKVEQIDTGPDQGVLTDSPQSFTPDNEVSSTAQNQSSLTGVDASQQSPSFMDMLGNYQTQFMRFASANAMPGFSKNYLQGTEGSTGNADVTKSGKDTLSTGTFSRRGALSADADPLQAAAEILNDADKTPTGNGADIVKTDNFSAAIEMARTSSSTSTTDLRRYSLSTVVSVAIIAFLLGSLLRSLLSPADFIYVVRDLAEAEGVLPLHGGGSELNVLNTKTNAVETGWREIRRLLEVKYLIGGWDFQIAVVRRH